MGNKIQKIYVWSNLVRPPKPKEFYYHLVNDWGSVAQLQSDWWTFYRESGTATNWWEFWTNWMRNTNSWSGQRIAWIVMDNPLDCSNAKKLTIQSDVYINRGSWNWASNAWVASSTAQSPTIAWWRINSTYNSGANGYSLYWWSWWADNMTALSTWNYTIKTILDLENKTASQELTWMSSLSGTITDAWVTGIRTAPYLRILFDNTWVYYKDIKMTIE